MGVFLHGRFDTQRQRSSGTCLDTGSRVNAGWNLVLSSGNPARALAELPYLDSAAGNDPVHLRYDSMLDLARFFREAETLSRRKPINVVHAHDLYSAATALLARSTYGYRVVVDYAPSIPTRGGEQPPLWDVHPAKGFRVLEILEDWVLRNADHVIVETRCSGRYLKTRYSVSPEKLSVIPNCVDAAMFHHDAALREKTRAELGLTDRLVLAHVGDIDSHHDIDSMIQAFHNLFKRHPDVHLLSLSCNSNHAREILSQNLPNDAFSVLSNSTECIPTYLNASDLGFLLLKPDSDGEASSPAIFAQYMNCGVPVIITSGVGDFSNLVRHKSLGEVLKDLMISERMVQAVLRSREEIAQRCVQEGRSLTWQYQQDVAKYVF